MTFGEAYLCPRKARSPANLWYTAFTADMTKPACPVVNADGTPKWRMALAPTAFTGSKACKNGYQDVGNPSSGQFTTPTRRLPPGSTPSS